MCPKPNSIEKQTKKAFLLFNQLKAANAALLNHKEAVRKSKKRVRFLWRKFFRIQEQLESQTMRICK